MKTPSKEDLQEENEDDDGNGNGATGGSCGGLTSTSTVLTPEGVDLSPCSSSSTGDPVKEQYMFLGNLYTFTRPRVQTENCIPATVDVTPAAKTQEDLHMEEELKAMESTEETDTVPPTLTWQKSIGSQEVDDFWMDLEVSDEFRSTKMTNDKVVVSNKRRSSLPSDIVKGGIVSLRTVIE